MEPELGSTTAQFVFIIGFLIIREKTIANKEQIGTFESNFLIEHAVLYFFLS